MPMELEQQILIVTSQIYAAIGWPGVMVLMAIETVAFPLPSELIMPLAGWMLIRAQDQASALVFVAGFWGALGSTLGSALVYALGLWGGRPFLERYGRYLLISPHDLALAERWFARYGYAAVFFSRLIPLVRTFISLPAGIARMPFLPFLLLSFAGSYLWSLGLAWGGYLLGEHWEQLRAVMRPFDYPILALLLLLFILHLYRHLGRRAPA